MKKPTKRRLTKKERIAKRRASGGSTSTKKHVQRVKNTLALKCTQLGIEGFEDLSIINRRIAIKNHYREKLGKPLQKYVVAEGIEPNKKTVRHQMKIKDTFVDRHECALDIQAKELGVFDKIYNGVKYKDLPRKMRKKKNQMALKALKAKQAA